MMGFIKWHWQENLNWHFIIFLVAPVTLAASLKWQIRQEAFDMDGQCSSTKLQMVCRLISDIPTTPHPTDTS